MLVCVGALEQGMECNISNMVEHLVPKTCACVCWGFGTGYGVQHQ